MYKEIKQKIPILEGHDDLIKVVLDIREAFNAKDIPFKITIGQSHVGNIDKYLANIEKPCRCCDCLTGKPHGTTARKREQIKHFQRKRF